MATNNQPDDIFEKNNWVVYCIGKPVHLERQFIRVQQFILEMFDQLRRKAIKDDLI